MANYPRPILMLNKNESLHFFIDSNYDTFTTSTSEHLLKSLNNDLSYVGQIDGYIMFLASKGINIKKSQDGQMSLINSSGEKLPYKEFDSEYIIPQNIFTRSIDNKKLIFQMDKCAKKIASAFAWLVSPHLNINKVPNIDFNFLKSILESIIKEEKFLYDQSFKEVLIPFIAESTKAYIEKYNIDELKRF
ncbi:MAG: hypothetical protein ACYCVH_11035 [Ignavibacteriaceae bacterium]